MSRRMDGWMDVGTRAANRTSPPRENSRRTSHTSKQAMLPLHPLRRSRRFIIHYFLTNHVLLLHLHGPAVKKGIVLAGPAFPEVSCSTTGDFHISDCSRASPAQPSPHSLRLLQPSSPAYLEFGRVRLEFLIPDSPMHRYPPSNTILPSASPSPFPPSVPDSYIIIHSAFIHVPVGR